MKIYAVWALWLLVAAGIINAVRFLLRKKRIKKGVRAVLIALKFILAIAFGVLTLAGPVVLRPVQPLMAALYVCLFADAAADAVYCAVLLIIKKDRKFLPAALVSLAFIVIYAVAGGLNMQTVKPSSHTYTSDKIEKEHTFVFLADLHVGGAQNFSTTRRTIEDIIALDPEFIVLGGDITDDYTTKEEMEETFSLFSGFDGTVYYIYGNHDRQPHAEYANGAQFTPEELEQTLISNGITILKDEAVLIDNEIFLVGREDESVRTDDEIPDLAAVDSAAGNYVVAVTHQPVKPEEYSSAGFDLQLSGHTHGGQFFPLRSLYDLFISAACGEYSFGDMTLLVTPGASGWRFPFRTESGCRYEVINLVPAG